MLATAGELPRGPAWAFEVKWDGMRLLAELPGDGSLHLSSRSGRDVTDTFPELAALPQLGRAAVLDGEVVAFGQDGRPSFARLSERMGAQPGRAGALAAHSPATFVIFDLLALDGQSLIEAPFRERRAALEDLALPPGPFTVPDVFSDGEALLAAVAEQGLEGVVAKRWDAPYRPGVRSGAWVKRSLRTATDAVVLGARAGTGGELSSLAVATVAEDGALVYRGTAGSGLSARLGRALAGALLSSSEAPAAAGLAEDAERLTDAGFSWCRPETVVEITHLGFTEAGRFRQPVVDRLRTDLSASDLGARPTGTRNRGSDRGEPVTVSVAGQTMRVSHLDKVLYPETGTTKAQVLQYYTRIAPHLLQLAAARPITRRRWPDGVAAPSFFEKNLPTWAPDWIARASITTGTDPITYPVLAEDAIAALVWLASHAALELHTPQWRVGADGAPLPPDRLVIDLDPGPGAGLAECCEVALLVRGQLTADGLAAHAVLSGSKGLHLYATLAESPADADQVTGYVRGVAERIARSAPRLVTATMAKQARVGRVFLDWSQNRSAKTTLAPWSLRGGNRPTAAVPVHWDEVADRGLHQLGLDEALQRMDRGEVPLPW